MTQDKISSEELHNVVLNVLTNKKIEFNTDHLLEVSKWLERFFRSKEKRMVLNLPFYERRDKDSITYYLYYYSLAYRICNSDPIESYEGMALYDIFGHARYYEPSNRTYILPFTKEKNGNLYFGKDTVISKESFIPIFKEEKLQSLSSSNEIMIYDLFILFSEIAKSRVVKYPVDILSTETMCVLISRSKTLTSNSLITCIPSQEYSLDELDELLTSLENKPLEQSFFISFPNQRNINPVLYHEFIPNTKSCEVHFNNRLCYSEIESSDITVLPNESSLKIEPFITGVVDSFDILTTEHSYELVNLIQELKTLWFESDYNPYKTPFPARWLTFIHHGHSAEEWVKMYENQFPSIEGEALRKVTGIIHEIYEVNWVDSYFYNKTGNYVIKTQSNIFPEILEGFYLYIKNKYGVKVTDGNSDIQVSGEILLVDAFNVVALCNLSILYNRLKVIVPDFLYFNHIPRLKVHTITYLLNALTGGLRHQLDPSFGINKKAAEIIEQENTKASNELSQYRARFKTETLKITSNEEQILSESEIEYDEIGNNLRLKEIKTKKSHRNLTVTTEDSQRFELRYNSEVLIKESGVVIGARALSLIHGLEFLPKSEVAKRIDKNALATKLSQISDKARNWKKGMLEISKTSSDLYQKLKKLGLSIQESTFTNDYITNEDTELGLPRSKRDWQIVCKVLQIDDFKDSWRNHKCKGDYNRLKKAYLEIISFLLNSGTVGVLGDEETLEEIRKIFIRCTGIAENEFESTEDAKEIVESISKEVLLLKVKQIEEY